MSQWHTLPATRVTQRQARRVEASARNAHQTVYAHLAFFSDTRQGRGAISIGTVALTVVVAVAVT